MIPIQHRQEALHRAYVAAVSAQAGIKVQFGTTVEYGVDGEFRLVRERVTAAGVRIFSEDGYPLDFQMKSTTGCRDIEGQAAEFSYDCEAKAYNKLVIQNRDGVLPILLLVFCLPTDTRDWLSVTEERLTLRNGCYWHYVRGQQTSRARSQVIRVPRSQLFTPDALKDIMNEVQSRGRQQ